jgi:hypothetical protein
LRDFCATAAVVQQLDLIILVDTSVAHLAGALGGPLSILLPYVYDWRRLLDRDYSPWYPTARLFRQNATRDWAEVVEQVREARLTGLLGRGSPSDPRSRQSSSIPASPSSSANASKVPFAFQANAATGAGPLRRTRISAPSSSRTIKMVPSL